MTENQLQREFLKFFPLLHSNSTLAPHIELKYAIGKYYRGREFGMPDTIPDVIEFDEDEKFHLWELKLLNASEVWTGKFFGQLMLYNFLFSTEPWDELAGRFVTCANKKDDFVGDIGKVLMHLASYGTGSEAKEGDRTANFSTWNLCVCGGKGYELAAGVNPAIWSFWIMADKYFDLEEVPPLRIWHFFETTTGYQLTEMKHMTILEPDTLHPEAMQAYI